MRVLLVNAHGADLDVGGAEKYVAQLAAGLEGRGHAAPILSAFPARVEGTREKALVLHATDWRDGNLRRVKNHLGDIVSIPSRRLREVVRAARPDVVHTHNLPGVSTAIWETCRSLGLPVVHTIHDYYLLCPRVTLRRRDGTSCCAHPTFCKARTARLKRWSAAVEHVIAVSDHVQRCHEQFFDGASFHVVRLPVTPLSNEPFSAPGTPPRTIGYIGALERVKGIEQLLEAAPELARLGYTVQIAGNGRLRHVVEAAATRGEVLYQGSVHGEDKLRFFDSTDLAVLPSVWDEPGGPPYSVAEWLAAGRPILVSRRGGLDEVIHLLRGVAPIENGSQAILAAVREVAKGFPELAASMPPADVKAGDRWLDHHQEVYELALAARARSRRRRTGAGGGVHARR
jgi:glycosyltransferase involved in cell wall biosynthesis